MTQTPRVLLASSYSAHYRLGVWRALAAADEVDLDIATARTVGGGHESSVAPIPDHELPAMVVHPTYRVGTWRWQPGLLRQACSPGYDIVVWDPAYRSLAVWLSSLVLRARGTTLVFWGLGWTAPHGRVKEWAKVRTFRLAHGFLTYSRRSADRAALAGYPPHRLYVVGNSISDSPQAREVARSGLPAQPPLVLGTSARLHPRKGVDQLLRAAADLTAAGRSTRVLILGEGPDRARLEELAQRLEVQAQFLGAVYDPVELADYYRRVHITVLPGHSGLSVVQSLMHGRPVVTHDNPDAHAAEWEALRPGRSGALFTQHDRPDLVRVLGDLADRIERQGQRVATDCREDYEAYGDPLHHARRIIDAVLEVSRRRER